MARYESDAPGRRGWATPRRGYGWDYARGTSRMRLGRSAGLDRWGYNDAFYSVDEHAEELGHTPVGRWPDVGHDLDAPPEYELHLSDEQIRDAVLENLSQDTWIDPHDIDVDVQDGVVTLRGEVRDFMEARYAWDDAWETAGVHGVLNQLTVRTDIPQESLELPQTAGDEPSGARRR